MLTATIAAGSAIAALLWLWSDAPASANGASASLSLVTMAGLGSLVLAATTNSITVAVEGGALLVLWRHHRARSLRRSSSAESLAATAACLDQVVLRLRSGLSLSAALTGGVRGSTVPATHPLARAVARIEAGSSLRGALEHEADGWVDQGGQLVATSINVLVRNGGPAGDALERTADTLRERLAAAVEAQTQAQQAVASASVMALLPVVFAGLGASLEPSLASFYLRHWLGCGCILVATLLTWGGWMWIDHLVWGSE